MIVTKKSTVTMELIVRCENEDDLNHSSFELQIKKLKNHVIIMVILTKNWRYIYVKRNSTLYEP